MRLLVVSNTPFLPPSAGNRERIGRMLEYLGTRGWETGMLLLSDQGAETWDLDGMRRRLAFLELAAAARGPLARAGRAVRRALDVVRHPARDSTAPLPVDAWCPPWFRARTRELVAAWAPDVVLVVYVFLSSVLEDLPARVMRVVDAQDVMHRREDEYRAVGMTPRWFHTTQAEERRGLSRADVVLAICDDDARVFAEMLPGKRVLTVRHGVPLRPAAPQKAVPGSLLCVASDNDLNVHGLRWFLAEVWPAVRSASRAELVVCGGVCEKLQSVPDGVTLHGFVPELESEYARARVVLSPVPGGTGLKVKVVDALCRGRPVVATRAGAAGIPIDGSPALVVTDAPRDFAAAVVRLLSDDEFWRIGAAAALAHAERLFTPDAAYGPLADLLEAAR